MDVRYWHLADIDANAQHVRFCNRAPLVIQHRVALIFSSMDHRRRNTAIAQRVVRLASRNGKVIFPSWPGAWCRISPERSAGLPGTLFLGRARRHTDVGPA